MKPLKKSKVVFKKPKSITYAIWHQNGIATDIKGEKVIAKIYQDGKLKDTNGNWEHIVIVIK